MTQAYPAYRASGVEWLGDVPEGWEVSTLKHIVSTPITDGPHETPQFLEEGVPFVSAEAVSSGMINFARVRGHISPEDHAKYSMKYVPRRNDIFMIKSGATTGVTAIVETDIEFNIWSPLAVVRCGPKAHPYYVLNFMRSQNFFEAVQLGWSFGTQQNIGMGVIENLNICLPPLPEQTAIAAFLDRETAKIDGLVEQQRRLIDLLREKRQAVISHAVTRGLNPHAPLKPSGVDWLGDVPEGWEVVRLRHIARMNPSKSEIASVERDAIVSFLPMEAVGEDGSLDLSRHRTLGEVESGYTYFRDGDVTYAKITPCFENGKGALMAGLDNSFGFGTTELTVLRPNCARILPEYLASLIASPAFLKLGEGHMYGAGGQKRVPDDFARDFVTALPPRPEQAEIVSHVAAMKAQFDTLSATAESAIALLQERRAALISAAVTGKIDVRQMTPEPAKVS
jgi:type I restriction enzyme S subunit